MSFERFIALKHLTHRHKTVFISLISVISILGVAVGVMALIVVLAVMSGFDHELKSKIVNVQPHLRIEKIGGIDQPEADIEKIKSHGIPALRSIASFVEGQAILRSDENASGVVVKGLDPVREDLSVYDQHLLYGTLDLHDVLMTQTKRRFLFFRKTRVVRIGSILIGEGLAAKLRARVGDVVTLISPLESKMKSLSLSKAETGSFIVKGIFRIGMNDFDSSLALIYLPQAQALYHLGPRVSGISVRFEDVEQAEKWKLRLRGDFSPDYRIYSWYDLNHTFFQALKVEKSVMTILLTLILLVAAFNIVSTLTMVVMEKTKDIGILRAIGATRASIRKIFVMEGFGIGFFGVIFGAVSGVLLALNLNPVSDFLKATTGLEVFPSDIYYFDRIPAEIHSSDVALIIFSALLASVLAGVYPAHRAACLNPIEALHYE